MLPSVTHTHKYTNCVDKQETKVHENCVNVVRNGCVNLNILYRIVMCVNCMHKYLIFKVL